MASTNVTRLGLKQWVGTDNVKRIDFVEDNILIDSLISALQTDKADVGHGHNDLAKTADIQKDYINAQSDLKTADPNNLTDNFIITKHANCPNITKYFYILNLYLKGKTSNRAQLAVEHDNAISTMYIRTYTTAWTAWQEILSKGSIKKADAGLSNVENYGIATKVEAETGTSNIKYMTPLRAFEGIAKYLLNNRYVNRNSVTLDFNSLVTPGVYINTSTVNAPNTNSKWAILVYETDSLDNNACVAQIAIDKTNTEGFYFRIKNITWGAWNKIGFYNTLKQQTQLRKAITVPVTAWSLNTAINNWEATITNSAIKATDNVDVNVNIEYLSIMEDAGARGASKEFNGHVKIYAMDKPSGNIVVDLNISREVI